MDPLLPLLAKLAHNDDAIQVRDDALRRVRRNLEDLDRSEAPLQARIATLGPEITALRQALAADEAELAHYDQQRKAATRSLETGVGNPDAAERQIANCRAAINTIEDRMLERMEQRETREAELVTARAELEQLHAANLLRRAELDAKQAELRPAQAEAITLRAQLAEQLPREERVTYLQLVKTRATALSAVRNKACTACGAVPPLQVAAGILKGAIGTCTVCGRWLYDPDAVPT